MRLILMTLWALAAACTTMATPHGGNDGGASDALPGDAAADGAPPDAATADVASAGDIVVVGGRGMACQIDGMGTVQLPQRDYQAASGTGYEVQYSGGNLTVFLEGPAQPGAENECNGSEERRVHLAQGSNLWTEGFRPPQVGGGHGDCQFVLLNGHDPNTHGIYEAAVNARLVRSLVSTMPDEIHVACHVIDEYFF
jgi:hypothetical protein